MPEFSPVQGSPRVSCPPKSSEPGLADRVRERSCVCSSLPCPVLDWAGFLVEALEAWGHGVMLLHAACYPSLDVVAILHVLLSHCGSMTIDPYDLFFPEMRSPGVVGASLFVGCWWSLLARSPVPLEEVALIACYRVQLPHFEGQDGACCAMVASLCEIFFGAYGRIQ